MIEQRETISIGEWKVLSHTGTLRTCGLGSCVCVVLYDDTHMHAGMVHIMLPDSKQARKTAFNPWRYADTALTLLHRELVNQGAGNLQAKIAGGAQMFRHAMRQEYMQIGRRNVEAVTQWLENAYIPVVAKDVGGACGRTVEFTLPTFVLHVRTASKTIKQI
ncbi:chemotaxis protein CheD [Shouchella lehensis]|uniref:Probable chemoreceptor glutamine deamidase CheD n=1 Tax=Shouchella lehensis TaxID=300825 RepID=A0A4Y7WPU0_9BACI|nr:chemotaxis protein CheD [Shouchella lehensis]MBG9784331.1 chemotaxis protein CheD [Shouchella lehensis]TES50676.1 chemotaxis protein CheD [Shouchella lehensis]